MIELLDSATDTWVDLRSLDKAWYRRRVGAVVQVRGLEAIS